MDSAEMVQRVGIGWPLGHQDPKRVLVAAACLHSYQRGDGYLRRCLLWQWPSWPFAVPPAHAAENVHDDGAAGAVNLAAAAADQGLGDRRNRQSGRRYFD